MPKSDKKNARRQDGREWHGNYRAKVTEVDIDDNEYGAIRVFVPALMFVDKMKLMHDDFDEATWGSIAYPANNPIGGYNDKDQDQDSFYQSSMMVPLKNSWVWIFFEGGDPNRPFYTGAFQFRNSKVPPENRGLEESHKAYTLCKTHSGRSIILCDSEDQQRVEICGKKRFIEGDDPAGDDISPYQICSTGGEAETAEDEAQSTSDAAGKAPDQQADAAAETGSRSDSDGNQTVILIDEREGKEKILIQSHKGDFIHLDIDDRTLQVFTKSDMSFETEGDFNLKVGGSMNVNIKGDLSEQVEGNLALKVNGDHQQGAGGLFDSHSGGNTNIDAANIHQQEKIAQPTDDVFPVLPFGAREY